MPRPVLLLAFADPTRELRLAQEQRAVRDALRDVDGIEGRRGESRWEVVERSNATLDDLRRAFADFRGRVVGFHYAGHATGDRLLLEGADGARRDAHAGGLAEFLGAHRAGLQFVFLNACSTGGQVDALLQAGVPAVIATSRAIRDDLAITLSTAFYRALAGGAGLRRAFDEAQGVVRAEVGDAPHDAYRALDVSNAEEERDTWPWSLAVGAGAGTAAAWHLGASIGDHTLGLPPLPPLDLPPTPYRRLLPFTECEARVFFGRGAAIHRLYDLLKDRASAPVVLLHGQSGAGKSSLVDAGLRPRLRAEFDVCYARRDPALGLGGTLRAAFGVGPDATLAEAWRARSSPARPLVVILDQVEEAYTRPNADGGDAEVAGLVGDLAAAFSEPASRPSGKVVLAFRKEWLPEIEAPLAAARLFHAKEFLARLDEDGVVEAVAGPARIPEYRLELVGEERLARRVAQDLLRDPDSPVAPTLQVLLTKMWAEASAGAPDVIEFDAKLYRRMRDGAALGAFLDEQLAALGAAFPEAVASGLALDLLTFHTTELATAQRHEWAEVAAAYPHASELARLVARCVDLSLLADVAGGGGARMLSHDTLAPLVRRLFDHSVLPGQRARRVLEGRAPEWADGATGPALDEPDLALVEAGERGMRAWTADEARLVDRSRAARESKVRARRRSRRVMLGGAAAVAMLGLLSAAGAVATTRASRRARATLIVSAATTQPDPLDAALLLLELADGDEPPGGLQAVLSLAPLELPVAVHRAGVPLSSARLDARGRIVVAQPVGYVAPLRATHIAWNGAAVDGPPLGTPGDRYEIRAISADGRQVLLDSERMRAAAIETSPPLSLARTDTTGPTVDLARSAGGAAAAFTADGRVWQAHASGFSLMNPTVWAETRSELLTWQPGAGVASPQSRAIGAAVDPGVLAVSADGRLVALRRLEMIDLQIAPALELRRLDSASAPPLRPSGLKDAVRVTFSPDGSVLAAVDSGKNVVLISTPPPGAGQALRDAGGLRVADVDTGAVTGLTFAADGRRLAVTRGRTVQVWARPASDPASTGMLARLPHPAAVLDVAFAAGDSAVVTVAADGVVRRWGLGGSRLGRRLPGPVYVGSLAFSRDGRRLLSTTSNGWAFVNDVRTDTAVGAVDPIEWQVSKAPSAYVAAADVLDAVFTADSRHVLTLASDRTLRRWSVETPGTPPVTILADSDRVWLRAHAAAISGDGGRIAVQDSTLFTISERVAVGRDAMSARAVTAGIKVRAAHLLFDRAGGSLFVAEGASDESTTSTLAVRRADGSWTRQTLAEAPVHLALSAAGDRLAVTTPNGVTVWDAGLTRVVAMPRENAAKLLSAALSDDGRQIAIVAEDGTVRVRPADGSGVAVVLPTPPFTKRAAFSPDGARLATGGSEGVQVWPIRWADALRALAGATTACLSEEKRRLFLGESPDDARAGWDRCERGHGRGPRVGRGQRR